MSARPISWEAPPDLVTRPDQLPAGAWRAFDLLDREQVLSCWRTGLGYLVLTNLRVIEVVRKLEVVRSAAWTEGREFFFYNLPPPRVVLGRFVQLSEQYEEGGRSSRFGVHDPEAVAETIAAAIEPGRRDWVERRATAQQLMDARRHQREAIARAATAGLSPDIVRVPCAYCGNPMPVLARRCPSCGAPAP